MLYDPTNDEVCKTVGKLIHERAFQPWYEHSGFVEAVKYSALTLAAVSAIVGACTETKKTDGTPNGWGKILIFIGAFALVAGCVNEWADYRSKFTETERNHVIQNCEVERLESLTATLGGVTGTLTGINKSEGDTARALVDSNGLLSGQLTTSSTILEETRRAASPLFPLQIGVKFFLHETTSQGSGTGQALREPFSSLLSPTDRLFSGTKMAYPPYVVFETHVHAIIGFPSAWAPYLAQTICAPRYKIAIQRKPASEESIFGRDNDVDLLLTDDEVSNFNRPPTPPETCADQRAPLPHFVDKVFFFTDLNELFVSQHMDATLPSHVIVDHKTVTSCRDLPGTTISISLVSPYAEDWDLRELDLITCGKIRAIAFLPSNRRRLGEYQVAYTKLLTRHDLGMEEIADPVKRQTSPIDKPGK